MVYLKNAEILFIVWGQQQRTVPGMLYSWHPFVWILHCFKLSLFGLSEFQVVSNLILKP